MLELVLALQLLGSPAPAPALHLGPARTLSLAGPAAPDLAPVPSELERSGALPRPVRFGTVASAALGIVVADVVSAIPVLYGLLLCVDDLASSGATGGCTRGSPYMVAGAVAFVVLPPAGGLVGARAAGERGDAGWSAYGLGLLVRLGAFGLAAALPGAAAVAFLATDLVIAPYVIARVLAGAPPLGAAGPPPMLARARAAVPVRDPALATR